MRHETVEKDNGAISGRFVPNTVRGADVSSETPLPEGFPKRSVLVEAGYETEDGVAEASDEALLDLEGVGEKSLQDIRAALE